MRRHGSRLAAGAVVLMLAACASPPVTRFHTLLAAQPAASATTAPARVSWELLPIDIPAQVDRPQMVVRLADGTMAVLEHDRWIAPLAEELHAAIAERLAARLGPSHPAHQGDALTPRWQVRIDVLRFDSMPGQQVRLVAGWTLRSGERAVACRSVVEEAAGESVNSVVEAHQRAAAGLADAIASALAQWERAEAPTCASER